MKILVDTCIWSQAFRRKQHAQSAVTEELLKLIEDSRVQMIGAIRQELLSGLASEQQYLKLKSYLSAFPDLPTTTEDYELAASYFNQCRANGIQGSAIDFLICAISSRNKFPIFTVDKDFKNYSRVLSLHFHDS